MHKRLECHDCEWHLLDPSIDYLDYMRLIHETTYDHHEFSVTDDLT